MDEHTGEANIKVNIMWLVKEIAAAVTLNQLSVTNSNVCDNSDGYFKCALYQCVRNHIVIHMKDVFAKEIESIGLVRGELTPSAVTASARKIIASPEMESVTCALKECIDRVFRSVTISKSANIVSDECDLFDNKSVGDRYETEFDVTPLPVVEIRDNSWFSGDEQRDLDNMVEQRIILMKLGKASLADVFETSCWKCVRTLLKRCLLSDDESVFRLSLKLHAKYLFSSSNVAMYESFMNLKSSIADHFLLNKRNNNPNSIREGIALLEFPVVRLLKTMSLISQFFRDGSKKYVRLPFKLTEEIIANLIETISHFPDGESENTDIIKPFHLLALVDPWALWAKKTFYHSNARVIALRRLSERPNLLHYLLNNILAWLRDQPRMKLRDLRMADVISYDHVRFAAFSHCVYLYSYCFMYKEGRNIFLQSCGEVKCQEILKCVVTYLNSAPSTCITSLLLHKTFNKNLIMLVSSGISSALFKMLILEPLLQLYNNFSTDLESTFPIVKPFLIDHIKVVLQSKIGLESFLYCHRVNCDIDTTEIRPVRILLTYTYRFLKTFPVAPSDTLKKLLECCVLIGRSPKGLVEIEDSSLISILAVCFYQIKGMCDTVEDVSNSTSFSRETQLIDTVTVCITSLAAHSGRVWVMERERLLLPVMFEYYRKPVIPWECGWFQKLVASSTLMGGGCEALVIEKAQRMPLMMLWRSWSSDSVDHLLEERSEKNVQDALNMFFSMCSDVRGVKSLLVEQEGSDETLMEGKNPPASLQELLELTLGIVEDPSRQMAMKNEPLSTPIDLCEMHCGLRILRFMLSSLDSTLLLQQRFLIQEHLMKIWNESILEVNGEVVIDNTTMKCELILRNSFLVESCSERNSCFAKTPRSSAMHRQECLPEQWMYVCSVQQRSHSRRGPCRLKNALVKFLGNTRHGLRDINWLSQLRKAFQLSLSGNVSPEMKCNVLFETLEEVQKAYGNILSSARHSKLHWPADTTSCSLFPEDLIGIKLSIRYGVKQNLLLSTPLVHSNLAHVLRSTYGLMKVARDEYQGFDWFVATVFLLCCGNIDRCQHFINNFLKLKVAPFLWVTYGESLSSSSHCTKNCRNDYIFTLIEQVELILSIEVPKVFAAFQLSSGSLAVLVYQWISQCFWNVLQWSEIKNFLCMAIVNEPDYVVFFCVAMLHHLEPLILHTMSTAAENFWEQIKINPVVHFQLGKYISFIEKISRLHHNSVVKSLMKCNGDFNKFF